MREVATMLVAGILVAAAGVVVGCSGDPGDAPDYQVDDSNVTEGKPAADPASDEPADEPANPAPDFVVDPQAWNDDAGADTDDGGAAMNDAGAKTDASTGPITKTVSCTSTYGSHKSVSQLTWVVSGSNAVIRSLYVTVHNSYGRNLNDVDVWVRYPNQAEYKAFNSGDILASDRKVSVKLPSNWTKPLGTRIRLETNFDQSGSDPSASCSITVTK